MTTHSILKVSSIFILLTAFSFFFIAIFLKYIYFDEEILEVPVVTSDVNNIKTSPQTSNEKNESFNLEIEILNDKNNVDYEQRLVLNEKKPELLPFKVLKKEDDKKENFISKNQSSNLLKKKENNKNRKILKKTEKLSKLNNLDRYRVQLGSFKDKDRATKALKNMKLIHNRFFNEIELEIFTLKKENHFIHRVWTELMKKSQALDLCNKLKNNKINCILQVEEN